MCLLCSLLWLGCGTTTRETCDDSSGPPYSSPVIRPIPVDPIDIIPTDNIIPTENIIPTDNIVPTDNIIPTEDIKPTKNIKPKKKKGKKKRRVINVPNINYPKSN